MTPNLKFKDFRNSLGLSQIELAAKLGVSQGTVGDIERGRIRISKNVKSKIIKKFDIEAGYFETDLQSKNIELKQGSETGYRQGFNETEELLRRSKDRSENRRFDASKHVDAATLTDDEILKIFADRKGGVIVKNIPPERGEVLSKIFEKQRVVAEKVILTLASENTSFKDFRRAILAIQSFQDLLDNTRNNPEINKLVKIEVSARHYATLPFKEFKFNLNEDFSQFKPYLNIFLELAKAMKAFADAVKEIPTEIMDVDLEEYENYLALNS